jgi:hypothetical protein
MTGGAPDFPEQLEALPPEERAVTETFGWQPANWGSAFVAGGAWMGVTDKTLGAQGLAVVGAIIAAGIGLVFWEIRRRAHPTSVVAKAGRLGIYRKRRLDLVATLGQVTVQLVDGLNTVKILVGLGIWTAGAAALAAIAERPFDQAVAGWMTLVLVSSGVSSFRTRHRCTELILPRSNGRGESVLLRRADGARVLGGET